MVFSADMPANDGTTLAVVTGSDCSMPSVPLVDISLWLGMA